MNKTYFLGSNTAYGFFGDFSHLTRGKTVILKGGAGTGKSTLMKKVNEIALDAGFMTETYRCSSDVSSFDAVFVPSKNFAVIDGTSPHVTGSGNSACVGLCVQSSRRGGRKENRAI